MNIPLSVVKNGKVERYVVILEELTDIEVTYRELKRDYENTIKEAHKITNFDPRPNVNNYHYTSLEQPDLTVMSNLVDGLWTAQKKLYRLVPEMATLHYKYRELKNEIRNLIN